jgi:hypothetical protein
VSRTRSRAPSPHWWSPNITFTTDPNGAFRAPRPQTWWARLGAPTKLGAPRQSEEERAFDDAATVLSRIGSRCSSCFARAKSARCNVEAGTASAEPLFVARTWTKVTPTRNLSAMSARLRGEQRSDEGRRWRAVRGYWPQARNSAVHPGFPYNETFRRRHRVPAVHRRSAANLFPTSRIAWPRRRASWRAVSPAAHVESR